MDVAKLLPYYKMFPADAEGDENFRLMTFEQRGLYWTLLNHAWLNDGLPVDEADVMSLAKCPQKDFDRMWPRVSRCFGDVNGRRRNKRQEEERSKAIAKSSLASDSVQARYERNTEDTLRAYESESESVSESVFLDGEEGIDFETFLHTFARHRGFKKPNKQFREKAELSWAAVRINQTDLDAALDGYFESTWGKERHYPVMGFLKAPFSWIAVPKQPVADQQAGAVPEAAHQPKPITDAPQVAQTPKRDLLAEWNTAVPDAFTEHEQRRHPNSFDPEFVAAFDKICEVARGIRKNKPDSTWLTFYYLLTTKDGHSRPNWKRLITDMRGMAASAYPESGQSGPSEDEGYERWKKGGVNAPTKAHLQRWVLRQSAEMMAEGSGEEARMV